MGDDLAAGCAAVDGEDGDAGLVGLLDGGHDGVGVGRVDEQGADPFLDQVFDVGGFFGGVVLGVDDDQFHAGGRGSGLSALFQGDEEGVVEGGEGEAQGDAFGGRGGFRLRGRGGRRGALRAHQGHDDQQNEQNLVSHERFSFIGKKVVTASE